MKECKAIEAIEILEKALKDGGYDGLFNPDMDDGCDCMLDNICQCQEYPSECWAGHIEEIKGTKSWADGPRPEKEECEHETAPRYDHAYCKKCGEVYTDGGWGVASRKTFKSLQDAKFYKDHGRLPE